jgi:uncharacterized protein DUF2784
VDPEGRTALHLAQAVLGAHFLIAAFVVAGMIAIPLGARFGWAPAYALGWRTLHLGTASIIAAQKVLGFTCFLSVWEFDLMDRAGAAAASLPALQRVGGDIMHWDLPAWFFTVLYSAVFVYIAALWLLVPPRRDAEKRSAADRSGRPPLQSYSLRLWRMK